MNSKNISAYKSNSMRQKKISLNKKKYKIELINKSNIYHINEIAMFAAMFIICF